MPRFLKADAEIRILLEHCDPASQGNLEDAVGERQPDSGKKLDEAGSLIAEGGRCAEGIRSPAQHDFGWRDRLRSTGTEIGEPRSFESGSHLCKRE